MIENLPKRLVLLTALLGCLPVGLAAQAGTDQDNTPYGTTSGEFLLLGAGARGPRVRSRCGSGSARRSLPRSGRDHSPSAA